MYWDQKTDRFVQPANFTIPTSFIQQNIRDVIIENHARAFAYFNATWTSTFSHELTPFEDRQIIIGEPDSFNIRNVHIYSTKTEEQASNTNTQKYNQVIEIITGKEQLLNERAGEYPIRLVAQNYADAIASIFCINGMPRTRLMKGFPAKQLLPVVDSQGNITYTSEGKFTNMPIPTLSTRGNRTDIFLPEKGGSIARSFILLDITIPIAKTQQDF